MLNALADDLIAETRRRVLDANATTLQEIRHAPARLVAFSSEMEELRMEAKRFLYAHLYNAPELRREHEEPDRIIRALFQVWVADPARMPSAHLEEISADGAPRVVADYIAGMTDQYILGQYKQPSFGEIPSCATKSTRTESNLKARTACFDPGSR